MTHYKLQTGETVRVTEIVQSAGFPPQAIYTLEIVRPSNIGAEFRLTEREMVLNGAKSLQTRKTVTASDAEFGMPDGLRRGIKMNGHKGEGK